jgi:hypothetical protein
MTGPRIMGLLVGLGLLTSCGGTNLYEAVPGSVLPAIDGVSVVQSKGAAGQSCCEEHSGSRQLWVKVETSGGQRGVDVVADGFISNGWLSTPCADRGNGAARCVRTEGTSRR